MWTVFVSKYVKEGLLGLSTDEPVTQKSYG